MNNTYIVLILVVVLASSGVSYYIGQFPIPEIRAELANIEADNLKLETQFSTLEASYQQLLTEMKAVSGNLTLQTQTISTLTENLEQNRISYDETLTKYQTLLRNYYTQLLEYQGASAPTGATTVINIPGIENGGFDGVGDPWVKQGWGGRNEVASLWQCETGTFVTQTIQLSPDIDGLVFDVKPQPAGASVTLQLRIGDVIVFAKTYQGSNSQFTWTQEVIPLTPIFEMRELYGFDTSGSYEIRFTVSAGSENTAHVDVDNISLAKLESVPAPVITQVSGIENGQFEGTGQPWVMQGKGGKSPYAALWQNDYGSYVTQTVQLSPSIDGLVFDIKPEPLGASVTLQLIIGETIIYSKTFTGSSSSFNWTQEVIKLEPLFTMKEQYGFNPEGKYEIRFQVTSGPDNSARVLIDNVSLATIQYSPP